MQRIPFVHADQQKGAAIDLPALNVDVDRGLNAVGAHVDQKMVQRRHLLARHPLKLSAVCDTAQQSTAICVRERNDLIG